MKPICGAGACATSFTSHGAKGCSHFTVNCICTSRINQSKANLFIIFSSLNTFKKQRFRYWWVTFQNALCCSLCRGLYDIYQATVNSARRIMSSQIRVTQTYTVTFIDHRIQPIDSGYLICVNGRPNANGEGRWHFVATIGSIVNNFFSTVKSPLGIFLYEMQGKPQALWSY